MLSMPSVGLDVHAKESTGVVLDPVTGEVSCRRVRGVPEGAVLDWLVSLPRPFRVVYEAGPTGYGLARAAAARGIDIRVCSPGHVQKRAGDRIKTDRRDAEHLARLLIADELVVVRVPSVEEEQFRDLVRAREDIRQDLMRVRHRLSKFLLRRAIYYPQAGAAWTLSHRDWLAKLVFDDRPSMAAFTDQVHAHDGLLWRRDALDREISVIVQASPWQDTVSRFRCFRGIDTLTAAGIQAEIGDWSRFSHPKQVGAYFGIVPSEHSTGGRHVRGHHESRFRARPAPARGSRLALPAPARGHQQPRAASTRPGPARDRSRLALPTTLTSALARARPRAREGAERCLRRRRTRARVLPLGGRHPRLTHTIPIPLRLSRRRGTDDELRPTARATGLWATADTQAAVAPVLRLHARRRQGHEVPSPRISD